MTETMQDSGIEWIGAIPKGWKFERLKNISTLKSSNVDKKSYEGQIPVRLCNYVDVYYNDVIDSSLQFMESTASELEIKKFHLNVGDVIITKDSESPDDIAVSAYVAEDIYDLVCGYHLAILQSNHQLNGEFLFKAIQSNSIKEQFYRLATGITRYGLKKRDIDSVIIPIPPIPEQQAIAHYLDERCGKLDSIIAIKKEQIQTLDALRQSIIYQAVTKGLDDSVELVDSGVEWLGEIPKGWKVDSLKRLLDEPLKYGANEAAELDDRELPRYIRITDFNYDGLLKEDSFKSLPLEKAAGYYLKNGDVLFARSGATVGKTFLFYGEDKSACFAGYLIKASTNRHLLSPEFLYFYTKSPAYDMWKSSIFTQATIQNIGADKYAYLPVIVPLISEQQKIVDYLDNETQRLEQLKANLTQQIGVLLDYKKSLIYECVTGKKHIFKAG